MLRMRRLFSALLSLVLPIVGAVATTPIAGATLTWGNCGRFLAHPDNAPSAQCTTVPVPIDYDNPGAGQAQLAVIRIPATGPRIGALLINPGGPGASAVDAAAAMAAQLAGSEISRRFDLVGFDPRGVGHSTPALRCQTDAEFDTYRRDPMVDYSPAGVAHIEQVYQQLAQRCLNRNGAAFLENVGTASAARDMDLVRQALGDDQINYLGYSYGTQLGTAYVERFADHVRAMVLDGAIDPSVGPIEENLNQQAGFQTAFNDYAADCARSSDCPLGTDPAQWVNSFHQLVDPLVTKPAPTSDPRGLSYADAATGTINALYTPQFWKYLTSGLLGLRRHTDSGDLLMLADEYYARDDDGPASGRVALVGDAAHREDHDRGEHHPLPAEPVSRPPGRRYEHRQGHQVGDRHRSHGRGRHREGPPDRGERHVDDGRVHCGQEHGRDVDDADRGLLADGRPGPAAG